MDADHGSPDSKPFETPLALRIAGEIFAVSTTREAVDLLLNRWPEEAGPRHREALDACYKVLEGYRSAVDAREALIEAAAEAGVLGD